MDENVTAAADRAYAPRWPIAGLLAGVLAWGGLEAGLAPLTFADAAIRAAGEMPPPPVSLRLARLVWWQDLGNSAIALGIVGAVLALVFQGFAGPREPRRWPLSALTGLGVGATAGLLGAVAFATREVGDQELAFASAIQALAWGGLGLGASLSVSQGDHRITKAATFGGAAWGLAYPAAIAFAWPWHHVERLIPSSATERAAWLLLGGFVLGLSVQLAAGSRPSKPALSLSKLP